MIFHHVLSLYSISMDYMNIEKFNYYTTEEFILDNDFMDWVLHPNLENNRFWSDFIGNYPDKKQQVQEAVFLIKALRVIEPSITHSQLERIFSNIKSSASHSRKIGRFLTGIAAALLLLVSVYGLLYYMQHKKNTLPFEAMSELPEKGKVILPDGQVSEFDTEQTEIQQTITGELTINKDTIFTGDISSKSKKGTMTHVIIPYGKRSEISLSDGSKIWLNSGSRLSYPVNFAAGLRKVYLSGEAFFDINRDDSEPFEVITRDIKIIVSGTKFNVTCYSNDRTTQAVLVSGNITAGKNKRFAGTVDLHPGERIVYDKHNDNIATDKVNVELYSSWINGYLLFEKESFAEIFKKLERYYNNDILTENLSSQLTFSGKLDLAYDLEKVLENIAFSVPFSVVYENGKYIIRQ